MRQVTRQRYTVSIWSTSKPKVTFNSVLGLIIDLFSNKDLERWEYKVIKFRHAQSRCIKLKKDLPKLKDASH
jgi:hypothetical protein